MPFSTRMFPYGGTVGVFDSVSLENGHPSSVLVDVTDSAVVSVDSLAAGIARLAAGIAGLGWYSLCVAGHPCCSSCVMLGFATGFELHV